MNKSEFEAQVERHSKMIRGISHGPGTQLKKILAGFGIKDEGHCGCSEMVRKMNTQGVDWCRRNIALIAQHLEARASERGWKMPGLRGGAAVLVRWAIRRAKYRLPTNALSQRGTP